jgi:predicted transcriptional regulator
MMGHNQASKLKTTFVVDSEIDFLTMEEKKKDTIPAIVADPYCREILQVTEHVPKSAMEINAETHIPISTVYRRIQTLCDTGLVETSGNISEDGKKFFLYKSKFKEISIKYNGSLEIILTPNRSI